MVKNAKANKVKKAGKGQAKPKAKKEVVQKVEESIFDTEVSADEADTSEMEEDAAPQTTVDEADADHESERKDLADLISKQNKKKKKSGGFQSMGLSQEVFRGVIKMGYKVPTPIQRKVRWIPASDCLWRAIFDYWYYAELNLKLLLLLFPFRPSL